MQREFVEVNEHGAHSSQSGSDPDKDGDQPPGTVVRDLEEVPVGQGTHFGQTGNQGREPSEAREFEQSPTCREGQQRDDTQERQRRSNRERFVQQKAGQACVGFLLLVRRRETAVADDESKNPA